MIGPGTGVRVYLACGVTDMRKGIEGLAALAQDQLRQKPAGGAVFAFCGRRGRQVEALVLGWPGLLPLLQSAGTRPLSLAGGRRWRGSFNLGTVGHAVGGNRLEAAGLGCAASPRGVN